LRSKRLEVDNNYP